MAVTDEAENTGLSFLRKKPQVKIPYQKKILSDTITKQFEASLSQESGCRVNQLEDKFI